MSSLKKMAKLSFRRFGLEIVSSNSLSKNKAGEKEQNQNLYSKNLLYEADAQFQKFYSEGVKISGTPDPYAFTSFSKRQERFYNLVQFLSQVLPLEGRIIECGCWKGLSSYIMCNYLKGSDSDFEGQNFFVVDSFEGLSEASEFDKILDLAVTGKVEKTGAPAGCFSASMQEVKQTLSEFPKISYVKGWIPSIFEELTEALYKFVHVDVDLYDPVNDSIRYFYPRLIEGGIIMLDDYGSLYWPGAKKAVDDYCEEENIPLLKLSTGQAVIWKH